MFKKLALFLAAALCVSCLFAGFAMAAETAEAEGESSGSESISALISSLGESLGQAGEGETVDAEAVDADSAGEEAGDSGSAMAAMLELFGIDFDAEAFYADLEERVEAGEELTVEDVMPQAFFDFFNMLFVPSGDSEEEAPFAIELGADGNELYFTWEFTDELSEEEIEQVVSSVAESFESEENLLKFKEAMESLSETYGIDIDDILFSIEFVNGDGTVMYEQSYSHEDILDVVSAEDAVEDAAAEALLEEADAE